MSEQNWEQLSRALQSRIYHLEQELHRAESQLRWYAEPLSWETAERAPIPYLDHQERWHTPAHDDRGERARQYFSLRQPIPNMSVSIKPPSKISTWESWPDDVRPILRKLNHGKRLSFQRLPLDTRYYGILRYRSGIFRCTECKEFCQTHASGACVLDRNYYCDDCMIDLVRKEYSHD